MAQLPVYLFTGFLEGGKTHIIQESMEDKKFNSGEKTLLIQCEEGEEEFDFSRFWGKNVYLEHLESEAEVTTANLNALAKKRRIDRIIIEYNGMWSLNTLYQNMPKDWVIYQEMMFADANTFLSYNANMRQLMVDKLLNCEMVVLNRTPAVIDKEEIHRVVRGVSRRAAITYDYPDGHVEYDEIEDPLPYDLEADVVKIEDNDYAIFYRDLSEEMDRYDGKTVKFKGIVARDGNTVLVGRHVMTCCADDIAYHPLVCVFENMTPPKTTVKTQILDFLSELVEDEELSLDKEEEQTGNQKETPQIPSLKTRDWVTLTGEIRVETHKLYRGEGPVLYVKSTEVDVPPAQEVATFY